jgi:hypothetical protein
MLIEICRVRNRPLHLISNSIDSLILLSTFIDGKGQEYSSMLITFKMMATILTQTHRISFRMRSCPTRPASPLSTQIHIKISSVGQHLTRHTIGPKVSPITSPSSLQQSKESAIHTGILQDDLALAYFSLSNFVRGRICAAPVYLLSHGRFCQLSSLLAFLFTLPYPRQCFVNWIE